MTQLPPKAMLSHAGMGADQLLFMCPQGPRDIYLGISGAVFGTIPTAFLYFSTYEWCKERLSERGHSQVCLRFSHHLVWTWLQWLCVSSAIRAHLGTALTAHSTHLCTA